MGKSKVSLLRSVLHPTSCCLGSSRAQEADALLWFFYISLTAIVALALVTIPTRLLEQSLRPIDLDAAIQEERLYQNLNRVSPVLGVEEGVVRDDIANAGLLMGEKKWGFKVTVPAGLSPTTSVLQPSSGDVLFGNQEFYEDAVPLAPVKYKRFQSERRMLRNGVPVAVKVDEVYPFKYDRLS